MVFVAVNVLLLFHRAIRLHDLPILMIGVSRRSGGESLRSAVTVATCVTTASIFGRLGRMPATARCRRLRQSPLSGTDDLEFRMFLHAFFDAGMDIVIDGNTGKAANFEQVAAIREALGKDSRWPSPIALKSTAMRQAQRLGHDAPSRKRP